MPSPELVRDFFGDVVPPIELYRGAGCDDCGHTGYRGRMLVVDLWAPDERDLMLITRQAPWDEIRTSAQRTTVRSASSLAVRCGTIAALRGPCCNTPCATSRVTASRTGVIDVPKLSARARKVSTVPGAKRPASSASRSCACAKSQSGSRSIRFSAVILCSLPHPIESRKFMSRNRGEMFH